MICFSVNVGQGIAGRDESSARHHMGQVSWGKCTDADTCPPAETHLDRALQPCNIVVFRTLLASTMVRKYERKTARKPISQDVLDQAKADVENGKSIRATATKFGMDESTLRKRLKKVTNNNC